MRGFVGAGIVAVAVAVGAATEAAGQVASPAASPIAGACMVEPRTQDDLERLGALAAEPGTPGPDRTDVVDGGWIGGTPVEPETMRAIEATLAEVAACEASGDVARLFALYTDAYIVREVLATEPVPILAVEPGTPGAGSSGASGAGSGAELSGEVLMLLDGRVVAQVESGGRAEVVVFAEVEGRWRIDARVAFESDGGTPVASPDAGVGEDVADLAPVRAAVADAAAVGDMAAEDVIVVAVEPVDWPDASLGCPEPGGFYAQVVTAGYRVTLEVGGMEVTYHTDSGDVVVRCEGDA